MLTRREIASLAWYSLLFSTVVIWAASRRSSEPVNSSRPAARLSGTPDAPFERSDDQPEMRRVMQRMVTH